MVLESEGGRLIDNLLYNLGGNMKKVGTQLFFILLSMIGTNNLKSTESELVSIKAFVRNQRGKIIEVKSFKKDKTLKVDGVKQQLSHFSIHLNNHPKTTSGEDFKIKVYDKDTIYFEKDIFIFSGDKQTIYFYINPQTIDFIFFTKPEDINLGVHTNQLKHKVLKLKITGFKEFDVDILIENIIDSPNNSKSKENLELRFNTSVTFVNNSDSTLIEKGQINMIRANDITHKISDFLLSGHINDIDIIIIEGGNEVFRKGQFCLSGRVFIESNYPKHDQNMQQNINLESEKMDYFNLIIKQKNKILYSGYSYFKE